MTDGETGNIKILVSIGNGGRKDFPRGVLDNHLRLSHLDICRLCLVE